MAHLMVTESLGATRALSNSSVLILLDMSSTFDTVNHQILLSTLGGTNLFHIIPDNLHLLGHMERLPVQTLLCGNWCPTRLSIRTASVFTLGSAITSHGLSYHCYADNTQLFLSFPLSSSTSSNSQVETRISFGRHLRLDSCTSPQTQP